MLPFCCFGSFFNAHRFLLFDDVQVVTPDVADYLMRVAYLAASEAANWNEHIINFQSPMHDDSFGAAPSRHSPPGRGDAQHESSWPRNALERDHTTDRGFHEAETGFGRHGDDETGESAQFDAREIKTCIALATEDQQKSVE